MWGNMKDKVYTNNPRSLDVLMQRIRETNTSLEDSELTAVSENLFKILMACVKSGRETV
jgi:hypothetical protein